MMLNKLPTNTSITEILEFIEQKSPRHGNRDRCVFSLRLSLRIRDTASLTVSSVVNLDGSIRRFIQSSDGKRFDLDSSTQTELTRYLLTRYKIKSLEDLPAECFSDPLFSTQKRHAFSPNTLAQHYSALDAALKEQFQLSTEPTKSKIQPRHSDIPTSKTKSLLSRFAASLS
ncbi:MAG: hypothetical protein CFE38_19120 [Comamonadaceae bacterium PBBC1]|nr:MAG: hypothetical protein CFE38_19120 [Comamonadaceae bacterium PBBC1]